MANFILDNTAEEINEAIHKVTNPDTTLTGTLNNDPSLITAGAVKTYVDDSVENKKFSTGYDSLSSNSGTASSDGFIILKTSSSSNLFSTTTATVAVGSVEFKIKQPGSSKGHMCVPIAKGESYDISISNTSESVTVDKFFKVFN